MGLAAAGRVEGRAVEGDPPALGVDLDHVGVEGPRYASRRYRSSVAIAMTILALVTTRRTGLVSSVRERHRHGNGRQKE